MPSRKLRWRKDGATNIPVEEACWQYLIDHAFKADGKFIIKLVIESKEKFMSSLQARIEGRYRFTEEEIHVTSPTQ